jgi:hypothetical protein
VQIKLADIHKTDNASVHLYEGVPKRSVANIAKLKLPLVSAPGPEPLMSSHREC